MTGTPSAPTSSPRSRKIPTSAYYQSWLHAFEALLVERGTVTAEELSRRTAEFASMARDEVF